MNEAPEQLVVENTKLAHWAVRRCLGLRDGPDYDDAVQEALVILLNAARKFDPTRGVKFGTYAARSVLNAVLRHAKIRKRNGFKNVGDSPGGRHEFGGPLVHSLDVAIVREEDGTANARDDQPGLAEHLGIRDVWSVVNRLDQRDAFVLRARHVDGWTLQQLSDHMGVSRQRVQQIVDRAGRRLRNLIESEVAA